jgi:peptidoglycan/LPS O-acetylase OafA/YrhL
VQTRTSSDAERNVDQIGPASVERPQNEGARQNQRAQPIPALTSLRFFLAIAIVCVHYRGLILPSLYNSQLVEDASLSLVPAFYCLSGFVLTYQYRTLGNRFATIKYFVARAARIVPLYWFCLFLALALGPTIYFHVNSPSFIPILLANLFLVQSWFPADEIYYAFNPPAYSLTAEAFMYLAFPFIVMTSAKKIWTWLALSIFVVWLTLFLTPPQMLPYFFGICPITHGSDFVFGVVAARCFLKFGVRRLNDTRLDFRLSSAVETIAVVAFICCVTICNHVFAHTDRALQLTAQRCVGPFIFAILLFTLARQKGLLARLLGNKCLIALGEASFAIYLLHDVFMRSLVFHHCDLRPLGVLGFALFCAFTLAASLIAYAWIEQPWRHQIIRWGDHYLSSISIANSSNVPKPDNNRAFTLLVLPILLLLLLPFGRWFIKAVDELPFCQKTQGFVEVSRSENVLFGDSVRLVKLYMQKSRNGVEIKAYWRADEHVEKAKYVGVHITDSNGSILSQFDHLLLPQALPVFKGMAWCDRFTIPIDVPAGGKAIALSVYEDPQKTFLIQGGQCDWGNHRLLLPLQAH